MQTWRATDGDLDAALAALASLPSWPSVTLSRDHPAWREAYRISIEGWNDGVTMVAACDLVEAVRRILDGALGHPWHPAPPELRMMCNRVHVERRVPICARR